MPHHPSNRILFYLETYSSSKICHVARFFSVCTLKTHESYLTNAENHDKIKLIKQHATISRKHLTPEIGLHLITKECEAWSWRKDEIKLKDPFWAFYWPGGQALSRYVLDNPKEVENLSVLDVGCGSGATAIAAAHSEAKEVLANDVDIDCCIATALNANLNFANLKISQENYIGNSDIPWDCVFIGDMFYDDEFSFKLFKWLEKLHSRGKRVFIGDPGRFNERQFGMYLQRHLRVLETYKIYEDMIVEDDRFSSASVLTLC